MSAGLTLTYDVLTNAIERLTAARDVPAWLSMETVGVMLESQTEERFDITKTGPDGEAWVPWSPAYKKTRQAHHSLLIGGQDPRRKRDGTTDDGHSGGMLRYTLLSEANGLLAMVGSPMVYAATHQYGRGGIPARPFLGISDDNERQLEDLVVDMWKAAIE